MSNKTISVSLFRDDHGRVVHELAATQGSKRLRVSVSDRRVLELEELKNVDTWPDPSTLRFDEVGFVEPLTLVATGSGPTERVGRSCRWHEAQLRLLFANNGNSDEIGCRIALVWDRQPSGVLPAASDIFQEQSPGTGGLDGGAPPRMAAMDRFKILWDRYFPMANDADLVAQTVAVTLMLEECVSVYSGTGANISDVSSGCMYLVGFGDAQQSPALAPVPSGSVRMLFSDA